VPALSLRLRLALYRRPASDKVPRTLENHGHT
jgi:hypothetical protein